MLLKEILSANEEYLKSWIKTNWDQRVQGPKIGAIPARKIAVFACMDTRLVELLEQALGLQRGDAKLIKNAGTVYSEDVVRSLVAAIFTLEVEEVLVVVHHDCGIAKVAVPELKQRMLSRGIKEEDLAKVDLDDWMGSFHDYKGHLKDVITKLKAHPFIPQDVPIHGLLFCPETGEVELVVNGY